MAIIDFLKKQFIDIIEWTDDSRDTLSFRFPDEDKEIKNGAQLIVRESQVAQFVYLGQFGDTFGPGKYTLTTDNIPILTDLKGWKYGLESPFKADVYYVVTRLFTGNKWGTANPVMMRDKDFGVVRLRAYGTYDFRIVEPARFLKEVAGTDQNFRLDEFADTMRSRIVSVFTEALARAGVPALDVARRYGELGDALLQVINPVMAEKYGLAMTAFVLENVKNLESHDKVARVHYAGLPGHARHELAARQMRHFGTVVSFDLRAGAAAGDRFADALQLFAIAASMGSPESLIIPPGLMGPYDLPPELTALSGLDPGRVRLSMGLEDADDLIADIEQALATI